MDINESLRKLGDICHDSDTEHIRAILKNDPNQANAIGHNLWTPLHYCAMKGHCEIALLLLQYKSNIDALDQSNQTPLIVASEHNRENIVRILLEHKADITLVDKLGDTALHRAAFSGHLKIVKLLVAHPNCDINMVNLREKRTPLEVAQAQNHQDVVAFLSNPPPSHTATSSPVSKRHVTVERKPDTATSGSSEEEVKRLVDIEQRVDALERDLKRLREEDISGEKLRLDTLSNDYGAKIDELEKTVESLKSELEAKRKRSPEPGLERDNPAIMAELDQVKKDLANQKQATQDAVGEIEKLKQQIQDLNDKLETKEAETNKKKNGKEKESNVCVIL